MHQLQNSSRQPTNFHQVWSCVCTLTDQKQWQPARYLRQKYLPYQHFTGCSILHGTFGHRTSLLHLDEPSAVFMWKHNSSTNQLYISSAAALSFPPDTFSIQEWSVVMFWDEQSTTNKPAPGPDREDMETDQPSGQPPSGAPPTAGPTPIPSQPVCGDPNVPMSPVHSDEDMPDEPPSGPSSSQRGQCVLLAKPRDNTRHSAGSLVDYESQKIRRIFFSTTVAGLYSFMNCFGTCQFIRGLWMDISGEASPIHMRTDAHNLVSTAHTCRSKKRPSTWYRCCGRKHVQEKWRIWDITEHCLSDCLTKQGVKTRCFYSCR